jgi:hypothetical protein
MSRAPKIVGTISIVVGALAIVVGLATYFLVHQELADQKITVSDDAPFLAGDEVDGPFSAYAEAMAINEHALEAGGGKTYAELARDDPTRETVMTADFLQASLFTSVVAFGLAALVVALGVMFVLVGVALRELDRRSAMSAASATEELAPSSSV